MFLSRLNSQKDVNKELDDPLLLYEQVIAQHTIMNDYIYDLIKTVIIKYQDDNRYKNSPRYLRLWLIYILYQSTPYLILSILCRLIENKIGDKLTTLYEAIAYFQFISNKKQEAEATLLLGLKNKAQPIKRLERVLNQFYFKKIIDFDTEQYRLNQYHNRYHQPLKNNANEPLKDQLNWINTELEDYVRASIVRRCHRKEQISLEELRTQVYNYSSDNSFVDIYKDIEDISNSINVYNYMKVIITPSTITQSNKSLHVSEKTKTPSIQHSIHTLTYRESNVIQLPHSIEFIQNILMSHNYDKRNDYFTYNEMANIIINNKKSESIQFEEDHYHVLEKIGQGGMAHVYLVQNINTLSYFSLKVQQPPHPWEFYIMSQIHERRQKSPRVLPLYGFYQYLDTSYLLMGYVPDGTLLDALNLYRTKKRVQSMPEPIVLLFILQLLKQIIALHDIHITHNDLKLDNVMMGARKITEKSNKLPALVIIDYGRSVDLLALGKDCVCKANWAPACSQSDYPLLNIQHHPAHADYWQLATMAHLLLFGAPMKYTLDNNRYRIQQTIKRYWHKSLWIIFFELMLNPERDKLKALVQEFENEGREVTAKTIQGFTDLFYN